MYNSKKKKNDFKEENFSISNEVSLEEEAKNARCCDRFWYHCGIKTTKPGWNIVLCLVVYASVLPVGLHVLDLKKCLLDTLIFPRDSSYLTTFEELGEQFSEGQLAPWSILIVPNKLGDEFDVNPIFQNETGLIMQNFWLKMQQSDYKNTLFGPNFIGTTFSDSLNTSQFLLRNASYSADKGLFISYKKVQIIKKSDYIIAYEYMMNDKVNDLGSAVLYTMITEDDPYYDNAIQLVSDMRTYLYDECGSSYSCYITGGSIAAVDSVNTTYQTFPTVLIIIISVVFAVMGFVFRSLFVPVRLFLTIALPMTFVYGLALYVYQDGLFSGLNLDTFANTGGLYWLMPVMTVTILVGLALDYDIFLFARIYEYRVMGGVKTRDAIVRGVFKTGSIITAAGIIMAIAFCGLLMSKITSLNQTGFILVVAVLVDTFVIRTSLVPAILSLAGEVNWWPGVNNCKKGTDVRFAVNNDSKHEHSLSHMDSEKLM